MREYEGRNEQVTCEPGAKPATLMRRCQHLPAGKPVSRRSWALHARAGSSVMTWKEPELIEVRAEAQDQAEDAAVRRLRRDALGARAFDAAAGRQFRQAALHGGHGAFIAQQHMPVQIGGNDQAATRSGQA